jgi:hypothetical protein
MLPAFDHKAIERAADRMGFTAAVLAEVCRIPLEAVEVILAGQRGEGLANLMDLLRVAGTLKMTMLEVFPWAKPEPPPGKVDFEILLSNRERQSFRVVDSSNGREV